MAPANFDTTDRLDPFLFLLDSDVLELVVELVGAGGGGVEVGIGDEVVVGRLMYFAPRTPSTSWTGETLSFELKYTV